MFSNIWRRRASWLPGLIFMGVIFGGLLIFAGDVGAVLFKYIF